MALVLAGSGDELSLCFIRRAEHPLDPWSGHMALPGGRWDPTDPHPRAAAERETLEEVGIAVGDPVRLTVTDTLRGVTKQYTNPQSTAFQPIQDTEAFATCP